MIASIQGLTRGGNPFHASCNFMSFLAGVAPSDALPMWEISCGAGGVPPFIDNWRLLSTETEDAITASVRILADHIAKHLGDDA